MSVVAAYATVLQETLSGIFDREAEAIERAAQLACDAIASGGVLHIFGTGHSHMVALEAFGRAGGLAAVNAIVDIALTAFNHGRDGKLERLHGYADVLVETEDLRRGEVVIVVSNSGINAVPIEFALGCKERGLHVVALTNMRHSRSSPSRHSSGRKLFEIADVVIDNHGVMGDAAIALDSGESV
ncbi:MAG: sugar isomerase domain-containing protein, partial [Chloroflexota bacterium]|nr:sugar isomerase domain-containing protein [Chloroflexota bacterium]